MLALEYSIYAMYVFYFIVGAEGGFDADLGDVNFSSDDFKAAGNFVSLHAGKCTLALHRGHMSN